MGLESHVDLRRRFDQWERDLSFFAVQRRPQPAAPEPDALWGDDPILVKERPWLR